MFTFGLRYNKAATLFGNVIPIGPLARWVLSIIEMLVRRVNSTEMHIVPSAIDEKRSAQNLSYKFHMPINKTNYKQLL